MATQDNCNLWSSKAFLSAVAPTIDTSAQCFTTANSDASLTWSSRVCMNTITKEVVDCPATMPGDNTYTCKFNNEVIDCALLDSFVKGQAKDEVKTCIRPKCVYEMAVSGTVDGK